MQQADVLTALKDEFGIEVRVMELGDLKENPQNPREHPDHAVSMLADSIEQIGFINPIIAQQETNLMLAGHGRKKAMQLKGKDRVPVFLVNLDDVKAKAFAIADNRLQELTGWDYPALKDWVAELDTGAIEMEITGFDSAELKAMFDYSGSEEFPDLNDGDKSELEQITFTLHASQADIVKQAIEQAKGAGSESPLNENKNGNCISFICERFLSGEPKA